jgi:hypothetical protein
MNACEIVKNIIPDGINQSREPIWKRLLLSDSDEENPQNSYLNFNSPEEWLNAELKKLVFENPYFEREYYAEKLLMYEEDLKSRFGKGFSKSNIYLMRQFYLKYQIFQSETGKLTWTHYGELLSVSDNIACIGMLGNI